MSKDRIVKPGNGGKTDRPQNKGAAAKAAVSRGKTQKKGNTQNVKRNPAAAVAPTYHAVLADRDMLSGSFLSIEEARRIASFDLAHARVSDDPKYVQDNAWQYYFAINLWLHIVYDLHPDRGVTVMRNLRDYIRIHGLLATIRHGKMDAQALIHEQDPGHLGFILDGLDLRDRLQALRFCKRFTPLDTNLLFDQALKDWLKVEKVCKSHNHRNYVLNTKYDFVMCRIREYLASWCKNYRSVEETLATARLVVPTGGTFEKGMNLHARIAQISGGLRDRDTGRYTLLNTPTEGSPDYQYLLPELEPERIINSWPRPHLGQPYLKRFNRLILVPKTADSPRIVCPESPLNQSMQRLIRDNLEACVPKWVKDHLPCRDQTVMEEEARKGVPDRLTTTDLSHASDSQALRHVLDAYPPKVARDLKKWRPTHTILPDGTVHTLQQFSTMGTGDTWYVMALFLLACMCVACDLERIQPRRKNRCHAFGDDMIHPSEITGTLYWILEMFGYVVNVDKSYGDGSKYRESCGSEWWTSDDGVTHDLRTLYYPRFPVHCVADKPVLKEAKWEYDPLEGRSVLTDTLSRFVELQHALYYRFPTASDFLTSCICMMQPNMTVSVAGSVSSDLWGPFERGVIKNHRHLCDGPAPEWENPSTGVMEPVTMRVGHLSPTVVSGKTQLSALVEEWNYIASLRDGFPLSNDPWLAVIGCTEARVVADPSELTIKWVVKF